MPYFVPDPTSQRILDHLSLEKTGSSIPCSESETGSGLRRPLLRDRLCNFCMVHIGFPLIKLSFDLRSRSILPYRESYRREVRLTVRLLYGSYRVSVEKAVFRPTKSFHFAIERIRKYFWKCCPKWFTISLVMAQVKFRWFHFLGLSNNRMLDPAFSGDQHTRSTPDYDMEYVWYTIHSNSVRRMNDELVKLTIWLCHLHQHQT